MPSLTTWISFGTPRKAGTRPRHWRGSRSTHESKAPPTGVSRCSFTLVYGTGTKVAAKLPANVVDFRSINKGDVALLKVEKHNLPSSELATDADVSIGTSILTVGFPLSTDPGHRSFAGPDEQERQGQQKVDRGRQSGV